MELATANQGTAFTPPPAGSHRAICYRFIDLGTQKVEYQGDVKHQRKVMLSFELVDEMDEFEVDGQKIKAPFTVHQRFTWSMHEKGKLRPFLESWRGRSFKDEDLAKGGFDAKNLIGVSCLLNVIHTEKDGRTYANIAGVSPMPARMKEDMPSMHNAPVYLAMEKDLWDAKAFDGLSDRLKEVIGLSPEFAKINGVQDDQREPEDFRSDTLDDDIPF